MAYQCIRLQKLSMNRYCLILGSNSDIGQALAYKFATNGYNIILVSRNVNDYQIRLKQDLIIRYNVEVATVCFDGSNYNEHKDFWDSLPVTPDIVISVFGYLGNQDLAINDFNEAYKIISSNYIGQVSLINRYVQKVRGVKDATIIGISSVAGERGRKSNYIYGSSKAAFTNYLNGLRNDLYTDNIHVMTVIPGFVKTKMLGDLKTPEFLTASPVELANNVFKAFKKKKDIIYIYSAWRYIMYFIKFIPEFLFKRMNL
jgi:decaprenylphospho-beta-D-erythro-pentofuranosid-2-ulose 2-reductase